MSLPAARVAPSRDHHLAALASAPLDLLIIGGGITGAALAYAAAHSVTGGRRLRVGLVEAGDFASGTSSCSSRLLHGGLRYLAQGRLPLVRALLHGRREIERLAPHLVRPTRFLLPVGPRTPHAPWKLRAALRLYRWLEGQAAVGAPPERLAAWQVRQGEPLAVAVAGPATEALSYGELAVHDARLVVELCQGAAALGAAVVSRVRCQQLLRDGPRVIGALVADAETGRRLFVRARVVVNAAGPAADSIAHGPLGPLVLSRGSHLVLPAQRLPIAHTVVLFSPRDRRALFASPRGRFVLVGTTEVPHRGPPTAVVPSPDELRYLFEAVAAAFPAARLRPSDVVGAFAGVRPLAGAGGDPEAMDRGYQLSWDAPGLLALRGGKLTLAPQAARAALRAIHRRRGRLGLQALAIPPALPPLPAVPAEGERPFLIDQVLTAGLPLVQAERLVNQYGRAAADIAGIVAADASSAQPLAPGLPQLTAELIHARRSLAADGYEDFARRRSDVAFEAAAIGHRDRPRAVPGRRAA
jgi:glycerol-3-phosphate dehydrogenase